VRKTLAFTTTALDTIIDEREDAFNNAFTMSILVKPVEAQGI
jgi:hypothetical protein